MKHVIMGTAGHVDHGKTSLVKALTGFDCDTHKEEKRRGITINLGFSHLNLPHGESIGIVDVPGHKDFINTMVGGACGVDFVLLVIAADSGIMPQTREHINILAALGISKGIVALTKTDIVDADLVEMAKYEISDFLQNSIMQDAPIISVSSVTGYGIPELILEIENTINSIEEKKCGDLFRMYIDRFFSVKGFGSVVTGSVLNGSVSINEEVFLLPGDKNTFKIRSLERHGEPTEKVITGDRAAINLLGFKKEDFIQEMIITNKFLQSTTLIDCYISIFENTSLPRWMHVSFFSGTFESRARMHCLYQNPTNNFEKKIVQIHLEKPAIILNNDKFIIRNSSGDQTLGGGYIMDAFPLHHRRITKKLTENLQLALADSLECKISMHTIIHTLQKHCKPVSIHELSDILYCSVDELKLIIQNESDQICKYLVNKSEIVILPEFELKFKNKILKTLKTFHTENPLLSTGLETIEIAGKINVLPSKTEGSYLTLLLKQMQLHNLIEFNENTWILKNHKPENNSKTKEELNWLANTILQYDTQKPAIDEIEEKASILKISKKTVRMYLNVLASEKIIFFNGHDFVHKIIADKFRIMLVQLLHNKPEGIEINEFRQHSGTSKRLCPLLINIYSAEKIITTQTTGFKIQLFITKKGSELIHESIS